MTLARQITALALVALVVARPASGEGLATLERTIHSYSDGDRTYTCLAIDGGVVPLMVPNDVKVEVDKEIKLVWSEDGKTAVFRPATAEEAALLDKMDSPQAAADWKTYLMNTVVSRADKYPLNDFDPTVRAAPQAHVGPMYVMGDFQPNILAVNHWRIGALPVAYIVGGVNYCYLLMLWRSADGTAIAVTMQSAFDDFKARTDALYGMIGGAMLLEK